MVEDLRRESQRVQVKEAVRTAEIIDLTKDEVEVIDLTNDNDDRATTLDSYSGVHRSTARLYLQL